MLSRRKNTFVMLYLHICEKEFNLNEQDYGPIINLYNDYAYNFLLRLYEFITKNKVTDLIKNQLKKTREK